MIQFTANPAVARPARPQTKQLPKAPTVHFGNDTSAPATETKTDAAPATKSSASSKIRLGLKAALLGLIGVGGAAGYVDLNDKVGSARAQNVALQSSLTQLGQEAANRNNALQAQLNGVVGLNNIAQVASQVAPANVMVRGRAGLGSGTFLQDTKGNLYILTNHHVVEDNSIRGEDSPPTFEIRLHNGSDTGRPQVVEGQVIRLANGQLAESAEHDLALIGISTPNFRLPPGVRPLRFRNMQTDPLRAGEFVVVVGTPHGLTDNVTHGIISHVDRSLGEFESANVFVGVDAPINPGNSGGSCYDMQGRYIGPPTAGIRGADGMGFVIRTDIVQNVLRGWGIETAN